MTDFNPNFNPNFNPKLPQNKNSNFNFNQNTTIFTPFKSGIKPNFVQQNAIQNAQNSLQNITEQNQLIQKQPTEQVLKTPVLEYEEAKMNSEVLLKYLQNVMKMPENINKLADGLKSPILKALVEKSVDVKILTEILNSNSTEAIQKVLKAITESLKAGIKDTTQLKDVLNILNTIQNTAPNNAVKELLLLYIPVNPPIFDKNVDFKPSSSEEEEYINNSDFTLIFETVNFSNISCCINLYENTLYAQLYCDKNFPFEKLKHVVDVFKKEMNLRAEIDKNIVKREEKNKETIRNFNILSSGFVTFDVLILAHLIIKTIFKIDETYGIKDTVPQ